MPRRPSERIERALFGRAAAEGAGAPRDEWRLPWVAPAVAAAALVMTISAPFHPGMRLDGMGGDAVASGPWFAALSAAPSHSAANNLVVASFTWRDPSVMPAPPAPMTAPTNTF